MFPRISAIHIQLLMMYMRAQCPIIDQSDYVFLISFHTLSAQSVSYLIRKKGDGMALWVALENREQRGGGVVEPPGAGRHTLSGAKFIKDQCVVDRLCHHLLRFRIHLVCHSSDH